MRIEHVAALRHVVDRAQQPAIATQAVIQNAGAVIAKETVRTATKIALPANVEIRLRDSISNCRAVELKIARC